MKLVQQIVQENHDYILDLRRYFRMHPEIGGREYETQKKIISELQAIGLAPRIAGGTGVAVDIRGDFSGKTVGIRADIDALPIGDESDKSYQSVNAGLCHACGHDGHMAMLLGVAKTFVDLKGKFSGNVRLLFQPNEEQFPGGAVGLIADGALEGVTAIIGTHLWQPLPIGSVGISYGRLMASPNRFSITVRGQGGHGSMPHQTIDALATGLQIANALRTIVANHINALEPAVLSLGVFESGNAFNVIPDKALIQGTVRVFSPEVRDAIFNKIDSTCKGICLVTGASYTLDSTFGFPPVVNNLEIAKVVAQIGEVVLGIGGVKEVAPVMVGEDFSLYLEKVPGAFILLGAGNSEKATSYPHHHPKFDIDEGALDYGVAMMTLAALQLTAG
ncbi:MAG: N-acetyldiaminopimelate deacetylase [Firmicutes bacterium]|nr:N-acetyldiaminopimelate deacetylase [Bacillota bacterium]